MKSISLRDFKFGHTYLKEIFSLINNAQINYNWLITNYECYPLNNEFEEIFSYEYVWLNGERLTEIINEEDMQFIWGVILVF